MTDNPPKVLSVCTSDSDGGAARAAYRIHLSQKMLGIESRMLVKNKKSDDPDVIALETFIPRNPLYKAFDWVRNKAQNKLEHHRWNQYPDREKVFMSDLRGTDLHGALHKLDYDILHLHWINQRFIPLDLLPKDKPIVWTLHDSWPFCGVCHYFLDCEQYKQKCGNCPFLHSNNPNDLSRQIWEKKQKAYHGLNLHIVTPSQWLGNCARQSSLIGDFPVTVIPNSLDTDTYRPLSSDEIAPRWSSLHSALKGQKTILFGAVNAATDRIKGFVHLLTALQQLQGDNLHLVVFGASKSELGIDLNMPVHYVGYVSDTRELVSLYNMADVMVVPSLTENLSCAIMESLSCQTPVVAFNIGGNSDMIEHQANGYLAEKLNDDDLANGILWCLNHNENNRLGKAGRQKVLANYTYQAVGRQYSQLYATLLKH